MFLTRAFHAVSAPERNHRLARRPRHRRQVRNRCRGLSESQYIGMVTRKIPVLKRRRPHAFRGMKDEYRLVEAEASRADTSGERAIQSFRGERAAFKENARHQKASPHGDDRGDEHEHPRKRIPYFRSARDAAF